MPKKTWFWLKTESLGLDLSPSKLSNVTHKCGTKPKPAVFIWAFFFLMVSQTETPVQVSQVVKCSHFNIRTTSWMDYTHTWTLVTHSIGVVVWRVKWKEQGLLLKERAKGCLERDYREWGDMQGAAQRTKEALMRRTVTGKGVEVEVIAVGRLGGTRKRSSRQKKLGKVLDLKNSGTAWSWQEYLP